MQVENFAILRFSYFSRVFNFAIFNKKCENREILYLQNFIPLRLSKMKQKQMKEYIALEEETKPEYR